MSHHPLGLYCIDVGSFRLSPRTSLRCLTSLKRVWSARGVVLSDFVKIGKALNTSPANVHDIAESHPGYCGMNSETVWVHVTPHWQSRPAPKHSLFLVLPVVPRNKVKRNAMILFRCRVSWVRCLSVRPVLTCFLLCISILLTLKRFVLIYQALTLVSVAAQLFKF